MQLSQSIKLRQKQSLVMTPQLQQAIKLLQMTNLELSQHLQEQMYDLQEACLFSDQTARLLCAVR